MNLRRSLIPIFGPPSFLANWFWVFRIRVLDFNPGREKMAGKGRNLQKNVLEVQLRNLLVRIWGMVCTDEWTTATCNLKTTKKANKVFYWSLNFLSAIFLSRQSKIPAHCAEKLSLRFFIYCYPTHFNFNSLKYIIF